MCSNARRRSCVLVSTSLLALLVAGCAQKSQATGAGAASKAATSDKGGRGAPPAPVLVGHAQLRKVPLIIDAIGAVEPLRMTAVRSQVAGTLQRIAFREGQDVTAGDLLFEIDPRPFRNAFKTAEADLQKLQVQLQTARAQVARYRSLNTGQMISQEQFQKIEDDARALEAELLSSEAKLANAKLQLDYSSIRAPISGRTGRLNVHEGDLVRGTESGALVTINQLNPIYVAFGVPQQYLAAINRYRAERTLAVNVTPPGIDEQPEFGELTFIDNTVDPATGTIRLKATFANERHRLWPGQFATVTVTLAEPEVLTVAATAVQTSQTGQHVYVVSAEGIAELRPVSIERTHDGLAVVATGLRQGETVVVDGQLRVLPGRPVEIKQPVVPIGAAKPAVAEEGAQSKTRGKKET